MTPVYQTEFAPPKGNCFQACIASLLDLPLEDVPHFIDMEKRLLDLQRMNEWMLERGLWVTTFERGDGKPLPLFPPGLHMIITGPSPRGPFLHSLIGKASAHEVTDRGTDKESWLQHFEYIHDPREDAPGVWFNDKEPTELTVIWKLHEATL